MQFKTAFMTILYKTLIINGIAQASKPSKLRQAPDFGLIIHLLALK
jgi:hypothetical protein